MSTNPQLAALIAEVRAVLDKYGGVTMGGHAAAFPLVSNPQDEVATVAPPPDWAMRAAANTPHTAATGWESPVAPDRDEELAALLAAMPLPPARPDGSLHFNGALPDAQGTPGAVNTDVTDDPGVLLKTIGTPGWTARVRPSTGYTDPLKLQTMREYGIADENPADYELDHLVPLCCGGHPTAQGQLWPQLRTGEMGARVKDLTEVAAQHAILNGHMSLADVQRGFCEDWTKLHAALYSNPAVVRGLMAAAMEPPEDEP
jgi:hypothetical protein